MAISLRLLAVCEDVVIRPHGYPDLLGIHWVRRVKAFPEKAALVLAVSVAFSGSTAKGKQKVTLRAKVPGQPKEERYQVTVDFGSPPDTGRSLEFRIPLNLTFPRPGRWRFSVTHGGAEWGHMFYRVILDKMTPGAAKRPAKGA